MKTFKQLKESLNINRRLVEYIDAPELLSDFKSKDAKIVLVTKSFKTDIEYMRDNDMEFHTKGKFFVPMLKGFEGRNKKREVDIVKGKYLVFDGKYYYGRHFAVGGSFRTVLGDAEEKNLKDIKPSQFVYEGVNENI